MFRKDLIDMLLDNPMPLSEIAQLLDIPVRDAEDDVHHLQKSLRYSAFHLVVHPAVCKKCGFKFKQEKLHKPGKCPRCHETWISEPLLETRKN